MNLSDHQARAVDNLFQALRWGHREVVLTGGAGTGKTTVAKHIIDRWPNHVVLCAPTGKAAMRLSEATGETARTMHGRLYDTVDDSGDEVEFRDPSLRAGKCLFVVDESSMVDADLYADFMSQLKDNHRVLWIGDPYQLPPVSASGLGPPLMRPTVRLEEIHRQAADSPIIGLAHAARQGREAFVRWLNNNEPCDALYEVESFEQWVLVNEDQRLEQDRSYAAICWRNSTRERINARVRAEMGRRGALCDGEPVVIRANSGGLVNGMSCIVDKARESSAPGVIEVQIGERWYLARKDLTNAKPGDFYRWKRDTRPIDTNWIHIHHGYAITAHVAQGSQWDHVCVNLGDVRHIRDGWSEWVYTAVTRASATLGLA